MSVAITLFRLLSDHRLPRRGIGRLRQIVENRIPIPNEIQARMRNGYKLWVDPRSEPTIDRQLYLNGCYEPNLMSILEGVLRAGDVFVDVGANIGHLTVTAAHLVGKTGRVLAVEPVPATFRVLRRNIDLNALDNVIAENVALGEAPGEAEIRLSDQLGRGGASLLGEGADFHRTVPVHVTTLDELLSRKALSKCRMTKIDVEGFESRVIAGGKDFFRRRGADVVCMEYSTVWNPMEAVNLLLESGYWLFRSTVDKGSRLPFRLVRVHDLSSLPAHDNIYFLSPECVPSIPLADHGG